MKRLFVLVFSLFALVATIHAQMGPETGMLTKSLFGADGLAVLEVALPSETSYNPAAVPLALELFKEKAYVEFDYGTLNFKEGPALVSTWQVAALRLNENSAIRLARYSIDSNSTGSLFTGDEKVGFKGETFELSGGMILSPKFAVGVVWVPSEYMTTRLSNEVYTDARFKAKSSCQYRVGAIYAPSQILSFGVVYSREKTASRMTLYASPEEGSMEFYGEGDYTKEMVTLGVGFQPIKGTIISAAWQKGSIKGDSLDLDVDLAAYGVKQYLTPDFSVNVGLNDRTWGYGAVYTKKGNLLGISYAPNTYRSAQDYLGRCRSFYVWYGKSW